MKGKGKEGETPPLLLSQIPGSARAGVLWSRRHWSYIVLPIGAAL